MIHVLWPTIRPDMALERAQQWVARRHGVATVAFTFGINDDVVSFPGQMTPNIGPCNARVVLTGTIKGATHSATKLTRRLWANDLRADDIFILASDDYEAPQDWDLHLAGEFETFSGALICNDGYKPGTNIIPLPIVSGAYLNRLGGVIYNPHYHHMFCDEEFHHVVQELGTVKDLRGTGAPIFHHRHWSFNGRDRDVFDMRNTEWWREDKATFERRRSLPLAEKLTLPEGWVE